MPRPGPAAGAAALALAALFVRAAQAQDVLPTFERRVPGPDETSPHRIAPAPDGSVVVAGMTSRAVDPLDADEPFVAGLRDYWVARFDPVGRVAWVRRVPAVRTFDRSDLRVAALVLGPDGSVWFAGPLPATTQDGAGVGRGAAVVRLAPDGEIVFAANVANVEPTGLALTPDGDAVVVGSTDDRELPVVSASQPSYGGGPSEGFVARIEGDGSAVAWSTYHGGSLTDDVQAVAAPASGEILLVARTSPLWAGSGGTTHDNTVRGTSSLVRMSSDGQVLSSVPVPHERAGGAYALLPLADGSVLVGGETAASLDEPARGFVRRYAPGASAPGASWEGDARVRRLALAPDGRVLAGSGHHDDRHGAWALLDSLLEVPGVPLRVDREHMHERDLALAPDGAMCVALSQLVGRRPLLVEGTTTARLRARRIGTTSLDVTWGNVRGEAAAWEVAAAREDLWWEHRVVGRADADARSVRIEGLSPGTYHTLRLLAVSAAGDRSVAAEVREVLTRPEGPERVSASLDASGRVRLAWSDRNTLGAVGDFEIHRRVGAGPWAPVPPAWNVEDPPVGRSVLLGMAPLGAPSTFRVRVQKAGRRSPWGVSRELSGQAATLVVRQASGKVSATRSGGLLDLSARFAAATGAEPVRFDPDVHDLDLLVGDAGWPAYVRVPRGAWARDGGVRRWKGDDAEGRGAIVVVEVRPAAGTIRVQYGFQPREARPGVSLYELGVAFGGAAGTDVRRWLRTGTFDLRLR